MRSRRGFAKPRTVPFFLAHARAISDSTLAKDASHVAACLYEAVFAGHSLSAPEARELAATATAVWARCVRGGSFG